MRGGQSLAHLAGALCGNPRFQAYVGACDAESAAEYIRRVCGVASRRDLDSDARAAERFHELRRRFVYGEGA